MQLIIEQMVRDFECGRLTRRQLAASLAAMVTGAQAASKPSGLRAVSLNHVTVRVADVQRTSQFYQEFFGMPLKQHSATTHILGVGKSFFGIEQKPDPVALDHLRLRYRRFQRRRCDRQAEGAQFETGAGREQGVVQVPGSRWIPRSSEWTCV